MARSLHLNFSLFLVHLIDPFDVVSVGSRSKPNRFPSYFLQRLDMISSFDGRFVLLTPLLILYGSNGFSRCVARHPLSSVVIKFKFYSQLDSRILCN